MKAEKPDKRQNILDAATQLFSELGFEGTSTRQIANVAGANMAMINYYFGGKEGVFMEIMSERIVGFKSQLDIITASKVEAAEKIFKVVEVYTDRIFGNISFHKMMHREFSLSQRPEMYDKLRDAMNKNLDAIESILDQGINSGHFRKVDVRMFISMLIGTISNTALSPSKMMGRDIDLSDDKQRLEIQKRLVAHLKDVIWNYLIQAKS